ncbi:MAG: hypothetical protein D6B28_06990 [Gammaproteobacteria bacterium]|nr:MAG: hypothetical protein D6B28_06990 [Gammaproteobacteria bacterium]
MKFLATIVCSLFIFAGAANATSYIGDITSGPAKQVQQMIDDFKTGDIEKAQKYIVEPSDEKKKKIVYKMRDQVSNKIASGDFQYSVIDSKVSGNWAVVAVGVDHNLKSEGEVVKSGWLRNEILYKNGDQWMVIPQAIRYRDPKVDGWKNADFEKVMDWWKFEIRKTISQYNPQKEKAMAQLKKQQEKQKAKEKAEKEKAKK